MRRFLTCGVGALAVLAIHASPTRAQMYDDVAVERDIRVQMGDGVTLSTDLYRPVKDGMVVAEPLPVLLHRTPYEMHGGIETQARYFARHGYVVVVQNLRGRHDSDGIFKKYDLLGTQDAYSTLAWLSDRPFALPTVGMWGTSYGAHTQAEAAKADAPGLGIIIVNMGGLSNAWDNAVRHGGAFELGRELDLGLGPGSERRRTL